MNFHFIFISLASFWRGL